MTGKIRSDYVPHMVCGLLIAFFAATSSADQPAKETPAFYGWALTPPMGWNSYDAFGDSVTENEVLANARYMHDKLLAHGWNYVVIDFRWYDPQPTGNDFNLNEKRAGAKLSADGFGRLLPAPNRFPSSTNGQGFKPLADKLHEMNLKFGLHMMRGIPRQAVLAKSPIEGSDFTAADAGDIGNTCGWCPDMFGVKPNDAGQAWYDAMFRLYALWGLDYIKVDDLSVPYRKSEIEMIRKAIDRCGRPIVFSTSPGPTGIGNAQHIARNANMWRISGDFWDRWSKLSEQFDLVYKWRNLGGPGHWPDADMIPFGHICIRSMAGGENHWTHFTKDEQICLISFWALTPSPLMIGANLPDNDAWTLSMLSNDEVIRINQDPSGKQAVRTSQRDNTEAWAKDLMDGSKVVGLFNLADHVSLVGFTWNEAKLDGKKLVRNLWQHKDLGGFNDQLSMSVPAHGAVLLLLCAEIDYPVEFVVLPTIRLR